MNLPSLGKINIIFSQIIEIYAQGAHITSTHLNKLVGFALIAVFVDRRPVVVVASCRTLVKLKISGNKA